MRTILEIYKYNDTIHIQPLSIIDLTITDTEILFHMDTGIILHDNELKTEYQKKIGFEGFTGLTLMNHEDALTNVRISEFQIKRRFMHITPLTKSDFVYCALIYTLENLPLKKRTLQKLHKFLHTQTPQKQFHKILLNTCFTLISMCRYIFYDEDDEDVLDNIPPIIILCIESKKMQSMIFNDILFDEVNTITTLSLEHRPLYTTDIQVKDVLLQTFNLAIYMQ